MSAKTRFVLIYLDRDGTPLVEGVFMEMSPALAYANEMASNLCEPRECFEVEGWRGRDFVGAWNIEGQLIEDRKGREYLMERHAR